MPVGIIEKGNNGLFSNEVEFNGKYALMVKFLKEDIGLFPTFREAYVVSAAVGLYLNKYESTDDTEKVQPASIFPTELAKKRLDLKFIYRIMMLVQDNPDYSIEDYINKAFREESENEENQVMIRENMKLFNSYACGGLEYLYNLFEKQDTIDKRVDTLYDFVHSVLVDGGFVEAEELPDFFPDDL